MPKFVLIDHSITDLGGHHYEYAMRVLRAAEAAGYEPVLATNRRLAHTNPKRKRGADTNPKRERGKNVILPRLRFGLVSRGTRQHNLPPPPSIPSAWRVVPVYRYGFWFQATPTRMLAPLRVIVHRVAHWAAGWKYRWYFSQWGIFWSQRHRGREIVRHGLSPRYLLLAGLFVALVLYPLKIAAAMAELLAALFPVGTYLRRVGRAARQVLLAIGWPLKVVAARRKKVAEVAFRWRKRLAFGADSLRLFRKVKLAEGDVVFIPTLAEPEMLGLLKVFERTPATALASWHLLFRRNIFVGRESDYAAQDESLRPLRNAFQQFRQRTAGLNISFYTDTEPLTIQYNRLGVANFVTAPIPVAEGFRVQEGSGFRVQGSVRGQRPEAGGQGSGIPVFPSPSRALALSRPRALVSSPSGREQGEGKERHIVYIGDARTEKGYHLLPHLVADLQADGPPVRFTFQSNYNIPGGEPAAAVARAQLDCYPADRVQLLNTPLTSDEYRELLLSADVVVVPYDRDNYYARSSGIFAEALAAGKPVVVPGGSWMATELSSAICDYHASLREGGLFAGPHQPEASARSNDERASLTHFDAARSGPHPPCADGERDGELENALENMHRPHPACLDGESDLAVFVGSGRSPSPSRQAGWGRGEGSFRGLANHLLHHRDKLDGVAGATAKLTRRVGVDAPGHQHQVVESVDISGVIWKTRDEGKSRVVQPTPLPVCGKTPTTCRLDIPSRATHVLVSFRLANHQRGMFAGIAAEQFAGPRMPLDRVTSIVSGGADPRGSLLVPLEQGAVQIKLGVHNPTSTLPLALEDLRIDFLSIASGLPAAVIGAVYAEPCELARQVRGVLSHYDHYRATAVEFSRRWAGYHSPESLVQHLIPRHHARRRQQYGAAPKRASRSSDAVTRGRRPARRSTCTNVWTR